MKTIIEKPFDDIDQFLGTSMLNEFNSIIEIITSVHDEQSLKANMNVGEFVFFTYGFGSSHMWVSEKGSLERLLIVEF